MEWGRAEGGVVVGQGIVLLQVSGDGAAEKWVSGTCSGDGAAG